MAYWNPDQAQGYYDPYQNAQERSPGLASAVGNAAKSIFLMGTLNVIGNMAAKKVSGLTGRAIKAGVFGKNNKAFALAQNIKNPTIGGILRQTTTAKSAARWFKQTSIGKARAARSQYLSKVKGKPTAGLARVSSAFKSPATLAGAVGNTWAKSALAGAPVAYMVDSALGITTNELGLERKSLLDIPGQIGNAAKWFGYESLYATTFGALGPLAGAGKGLAAKGLKKTFDGPIGEYAYKTMRDVQGNAFDELKRSHKGLAEHNFFKKSLTSIPPTKSNQGKTFASKLITKASYAGMMTKDVGRYINRMSSPMGQAIKEGIATPGGIKRKFNATKKPMIAALKNIQALKARVDRRRTLAKAPVSADGLKAVEFLTQLRNKPVDGQGLSLEDFNKFMGPEFQKLQKEGLQDWAHSKLKRTKVKDLASREWLDETAGALKKKYASGSVDTLMKQVTNMNVGRHIYHRSAGGHIKGGGVNLSAFDPLYVAKRALSGLVDHQVRVPFSGGMKFALGDLTGWSDLLAEKENLHIFRDKPNFSLGLQHGLHGDAVSVGDLAKDKDAIFMNIGSKWGVFDGTGVKHIDTGRVLRFARPNSKVKTRELDWIQKQRILQKTKDEQETLRIGQLRRAVPKSNNRFLNWLDDRGLQLPGIAQTALRGLNAKLGGRRDAYLQSFSSVFGTHSTTRESYANLPNVNNLLQHTSQVFSRILHREDALMMIGEYSGDKHLKKNLAEVLWSGRPIEDQYKSLGLDINDAVRRKPELAEAIEKIKAFPKEAEKNIAVKRLGFGSEMNSYDVARVSLIDDFLNKSYFNNMAGNGHVHPLANAAGLMKAKGLITEKEMKALQFHSKLSALNDLSPFRRSGGLAHDFKNEQAFKTIRDHAKSANWDIIDDARDYIANNQLRSPRIQGNFEEVLAERKIPFVGDNLPYASVPEGIGKRAIDYSQGVADSLGGLLEQISPLRRNPAKHFGLTGTARYIAKNAATIGLAWQGYRVADALVASTPMMDNTSFDEGITGFLSDNIAKTRLVGAKISDTFGITGMAKHLEGLMPKSTTTLPGMLAGAAAGRFFGGGLGSSLMGMAWGGVINRFASPYLPDITKDYEELKEIYAGRETVPMMKSPTWLLGGTPWEGSKVEGFTPNWYVRAKSRWKETETMYGSAFRKLIHEPIPLLGFNIGDVLDPYYMERLHYFDRPYPVTGAFGEEVPIIGDLVSSTIGRIIKPEKTMHQEYLQDDWEKENLENNTYGINNPPPSVQDHHRLMNNGSSPVRSMGGRSTLEGNFVYGKKNWADTSARKFLNDATNAAGLPGFLTRTALEKTLGSPKVIPTLESAGRMASMSRSYYDMNLGGLGILTEPVRRLIAKPEYERYGLNPIPNMMPNWLPDRFLKGDPYCVTGKTLIEVNSLDGLKLKPAFEVTTQDRVRTHTGKIIKPSAIKKRSMTADEKLYRLGITSLAAFPIEASEEHPIYTRKGWVPIKNIKVGDYVGYPVPNKEEWITDEHQLDISLYTNKDLPCTTYHIYTSGCDQKFASMIEYIENNNKMYKRGELKLILDKFGWDRKQFERAQYAVKKGYSRRIPRYIDTVNINWGRLIGYYLSEGFIIKSKGRVCGVGFAFHKDETLYHIEVKNAVKNIFGLDCCEYECGNGKTIQVHNTAVAILFNRLFGSGFDNKILIPQPEQTIKEVVRTLFNGDGSYFFDKGKPRLSLKLANPLLLYQVRHYLLTQGFISNIVDNNLIIRGQAAKECALFLNTKYRETKDSSYTCTHTKIENGYIWMRIFKKEIVPNEDVYGFQVDIDDSFCTAGVATHNSKLMKGELRLPGKAYQATHTNVKMDMPARGSMIGGDMEHIVQYFTGLLPPTLKEHYDIMETGTKMHGIIQDQLQAEGLLVNTEQFIVDVKNDITGHLDAVIRDGTAGKGKRALEIKTINREAFEKLDAPKYEHVGQLNFYLRQTRLYDGAIMYVMRDNPSQVKTFNVKYSRSRFEKDLNKLQKARQIAADMMQEGVEDKYGFSYSWLDRLNILSDVAPASKEYKEAKHVVELQIKHGRFSEKEITKYKTALKNRQTRLRKYELYPLRFKGKVMSPDTEVNIQSINENIKAGREYNIFERVVGAAWETFTNTNFFAINKLWNVKDPLEHYKMNRLYGKEFKPWDEPHRGWIEPLGRGLASKRDGFSGALGWATTGMVFGGPAWSMLGGAVGAGYGTVHGMYRKASSTQYIPEIVQNQRDLEAYFDAAKYEKNRRLAMLSNGATAQEYQTMSENTLTAFNRGEGGNIANLFRSTPVTEKPYIEAWLNESDPNRQEEILSYVPSNLGNALKRQWGQNEQSEYTRDVNDNNSAELATGGPQYNFDDAIFDPTVNLEDIKLKTLEAQGYDAHEYGLGWNEQLLRLSSYDNEIKALNRAQYAETQVDNTNLNQGQIKGAIMEALRQNNVFGTVNTYVNNYNDEYNAVNIVIKRDRSQAIVASLENREKWMYG